MATYENKIDGIRDAYFELFEEIYIDEMELFLTDETYDYFLEKETKLRGDNFLHILSDVEDTLSEKDIVETVIKHAKCDAPFIEEDYQEQLRNFNEDLTYEGI